MGSCSSKPTGPIQIPDNVALIGFPRSFHMTWMKSWSNLVIQVSTQGSQPIYSASMPEGFGGCTVLYLWSNIEGSPMAYIIRTGHEFTIDLPGVPSCGIMPHQVTMRYESSMTEVRYSFTMMVGYGNSYRSESFEWRRSGGNKVKSLGKSSSGWKLVRLGPNTNGDYLLQYPGHTGQQYGNGYPSQYGISMPAQTGPGFSSDGKEVVAVFAGAQSFSFSMHDVGEFQYMGSGATPGMGYHWALMAALTGICVYQHQMARETNQTGGTAAASAAGAIAGAVAGV